MGMLGGHAGRACGVGSGGGAVFPAFYAEAGFSALYTKLRLHPRAVDLRPAWPRRVDFTPSALRSRPQPSLLLFTPFNPEVVFGSFSVIGGGSLTLVD